MLLTILREIFAESLLAVVLSFLFWGMWQRPVEVTALLVVASLIGLRIARPYWKRFTTVLHTRFNQWLEWPLWRHTASVHEAGHVIVAHCLGLPVVGYALTPAASHLHQTCGSTHFAPGPIDDPERLLVTLTVLVSGKVSEEAIFGRAHGANHDLRQLENWAAIIDASLIEQGRVPVGLAFWQQVCEAKALELLDSRRSLIESVAAAMQQQAPIEQILDQIDKTLPQPICV